MGEGGSKDAEHAPADHQASAGASDMTPSQQGFSTCFKSEKRNASFPLWELTFGEQELKFMDVRVNHAAISDPEGLLAYEMFWSGELEGLDQDAFKRTVAECLMKYGAKMSLDDSLRECGCMISMVAVPFEITDENALKLGHAMFDDFGNVQEKKDEEAK